MLKSHSALVGLAILKVNWDETQSDYVDNFLPLVRECLRVRSVSIATAPDVRQALEDDFGLQLPLSVVRTLLQRGRKRGFLQERQRSLHVVDSEVNSTDFLERRQSLEDRLSLAIRRLIEFARSNHEEEWTVQDCERHLLAFLALRDDDILAASAMGEIGGRTPVLKERAAFIVSSFIEFASNSDSEAFSAIETVAQGSVLASALFLTHPERLGEKFHNTRIFLDSPFLLSLLGYAGEERQAPCVELVQMIRSSGATLHAFHETVDEVRGILSACAARLRSPARQDNFRDALDYFIATGKSSSDVELLAARLTSVIETRGIEVCDTADITTTLPIDERILENHLSERIAYRRKDAMLHDLKCVVSIAAERGERTINSLENAPSLFLTQNVPLSRIAQEIYSQGRHESVVPLVITDHVLGNILWLKDPAKSPTLPRKRLIADAYAAMQPSDEIWKKYLTEIALLRERGEIQEADYMLLRYSIGSRRSLMQITEGDVDAFTEGTVHQVLEASIHALTSEHRERQAAAEGQVARVTAEAAAAAELMQSRLTEVTGELEAQAELTKLDGERRRSRARSRAKRTISALRWGALLIIAALQLTEFLQEDTRWLPGWLDSVPSLGVSLTLLIVNFVSSVPESAGHRVVTWLERRIEAWFALDEG